MQENRTYRRSDNSFLNIFGAIEIVYTEACIYLLITYFSTLLRRASWDVGIASKDELSDTQSRRHQR